MKSDGPCYGKRNGRVSALAAEWIEIYQISGQLQMLAVSALAAEWIEIKYAQEHKFTRASLRPRGGVD